MGRTHRPTLGRITPSGHPCCYMKYAAPSIPPQTDCPSVHPATFSDSPDSISSCVLHCTALLCAALQQHPPARHRSGSTATLAPGLGHDRLCLSPRPDSVASQAWNLHSSFEVTVTGRWQKEKKTHRCSRECLAGPRNIGRQHGRSEICHPPPSRYCGTVAHAEAQ